MLEDPGIKATKDPLCDCLLRGTSTAALISGVYFCLTPVMWPRWNAFMNPAGQRNMYELKCEVESRFGHDTFFHHSSGSGRLIFARWDQFLHGILINPHMAVGQNQWYHLGVGAQPMLVYFSGAWDVHWGYGILTHGQMSVHLGALHGILITPHMAVGQNQ